MFNLNCEDWWQNNSLEDWYKYAWQDPYPLLEDNPQPHQENDYYHQQWLQDHLIRHGIISSSYSNPINTWVMSAINNPYVYRLEDILKNALPVYDTQFLFDTGYKSNYGYYAQIRFYRFYKRKTYEVLKHNYHDDDGHVNTYYFVRTV
jgi:hypothetical protein